MTKGPKIYNLWRKSSFSQRRWNVFLGLFFVSVLLFLVSLFFQRSSSPRSPIISQDEQVLWSPHLNTVNAQGDEYSVHAKKMIYGEKDGYIFYDVDASLAKHGDKIFFLSAKKGEYHVDGCFSLQGDVCSHTKDGWYLKTQSATFFLEKSYVEGHERVTGFGPVGTFSAEGFSIESTRIVLKKNAEIVITTEDDFIPLSL